MARGRRTQIAEQTLAICEAGSYTTRAGSTVSIAAVLKRARLGTKVHSGEGQAPRNQRGDHPARLEVTNETTLQALARLAGAESTHLACLNFASAKNPGGGFLRGAEAQEEALARASGLYPCLQAAPEYYERNRAHRSALYLDLVIFSPLVPFFRDDAGDLLEVPVLASVVTAPAPNAGAVGRNEPHNVCLIEPTLRRRAERVLEVAAAHDVARLVLGAWGCGVFRNDPRLVARVFAELLRPPGRFARVFTQVVFAVMDRRREEGNLRAFVDELQRSGSAPEV